MDSLKIIMKEPFFLMVKNDSSIGYEIFKNPNHLEEL